jgi:hypothetical protein
LTYQKLCMPLTSVPPNGNADTPGSSASGASPIAQTQEIGGVDGASRGAERAQIALSKPVIARRRNLPTTSQVAMVPTRPTTVTGQGEERIYWCVDTTWSQVTKTRPSAITGLKSLYDSELAVRLVKDYDAIRGWRGLLFSWRTCTGIEFIQVKSLILSED